jgi:hypothetical protein
MDKPCPLATTSAQDTRGRVRTLDSTEAARPLLPSALVQAVLLRVQHLGRWRRRCTGRRQRDRRGAAVLPGPAGCVEQRAAEAVVAVAAAGAHWPAEGGAQAGAGARVPAVEAEVGVGRERLAEHDLHLEGVGQEMLQTRGATVDESEIKCVWWW